MRCEQLLDLRSFMSMMQRQCLWHCTRQVAVCVVHRVATCVRLEHVMKWAGMIPSLRTILARDSVARFLAVFFVLGAVLLLVLLWSTLHPPPPPRAFELHVEAESHTTSLVVVSVLGVIALPMRLIAIRRMFRIGVEVEGRIDRVQSLSGMRSGGRSNVFYTYVVDQTSYTKHHAVAPAQWREYAERYNGRVPVLVHPRNPKRAILKHAFQLERIPRARVV